MKFSEWMRMHRSERGITIYQLAKATGVTRQQLSNYEAGTSEPTIGKAEIICKALRIKFTVG